MSESDIPELCRRIYQKHQTALDLIYKHRPDRQATIRDWLVALIHQAPELVPDSTGKGEIFFAPNDWKDLKGDAWTMSKRMLLFLFVNSSDSLRLKLVIGPGPRQTREALHQWALDSPSPVFRATEKRLFEKYNTIYNLKLLLPKDYEDTDEELEQKISQQWQKFLDDDLPGIKSTLHVADFITPDSEPKVQPNSGVLSNINN